MRHAAGADIHAVRFLAATMSFSVWSGVSAPTNNAPGSVSTCQSRNSRPRQKTVLVWPNSEPQDPCSRISGYRRQGRSYPSRPHSQLGPVGSETVAPVVWSKRLQCALHRGAEPRQRQPVCIAQPNIAERFKARSRAAAKPSYSIRGSQG
jgi:hypothetical protein